jgi:DNA-binding LacI/PurR family transcriptional regulator
MRSLVEEGVLCARVGKGTFIGEEFRGENAVATQALHVLSPTRFDSATTLPFFRLVHSIAESLGGLGVHINTPPEKHGMDYLDETVIQPFREGRIRIVLAVSCPWRVYQYLRDQGVPALVFGSMFPNRQFLPSIDKDSARGAGMLVDYLVGRGHKNLGVIMPSTGLAGVDLFTDSVSRRLSTYGIPADSISMRYCSGDGLVTIDRIRALLLGSNRPTALITDEEDLANLASQAARSIGLLVPQDVEIVFEGSVFRTGDGAGYPHTAIELDESAFAGEVIALIHSLPGSQTPPAARFLPVRLITQ